MVLSFGFFTILMPIETVVIDTTQIKFALTVPRSRVRMADKFGNHIARPLGAKLSTDSYIEWMITNPQLKALSEAYLNDADKDEVRRKITAITKFLKESEYAKRIATETGQIKEEFLGFKISKYTETFYSFLKLLPSNISIRHTFKQGDFTLAVNYYVLLPFGNQSVKVFDKQSNTIPIGSELGSGTYAIWKPTKDDVKNIIESLAYASVNHRDDILKLI